MGMNTWRRTKAYWLSITLKLSFFPEAGPKIQFVCTQNSSEVCNAFVFRQAKAETGRNRNALSVSSYRISDSAGGKFAFHA